MIDTDRLILRSWRVEDLAPWAALNADPEVMRFFPSVLTPEDSEAMLARNQDHIDRHGFGLWAVERREDGAFLGFTGLMMLKPDNPLAPGVEAGWRLARHAWGQGYASEAAAAAIRDGFERVGLDRIVAFTATTNLPSQAVMRRLGMTRREDLDFDHPSLPKGHPLERHVVWESTKPSSSRP
ncbi:MAG TPA: GNAT family N-acetyltransferase [Caulobacter sp.]|nr:GNAT family N-acetyltransferase [Caulobacter sp.]